MNVNPSSTANSRTHVQEQSETQGRTQAPTFTTSGCRTSNGVDANPRSNRSSTHGWRESARPTMRSDGMNRPGFEPRTFDIRTPAGQMQLKFSRCLDLKQLNEFLQTRGGHVQEELHKIARNDPEGAEQLINNLRMRFGVTREGDQHLHAILTHCTHAFQARAENVYWASNPHGLDIRDPDLDRY